MLRRSENGVGDGPLRSAEISRVAPPYADDDVGACLFVAPEAPLGEKKPRPSRCRSCGRSERSSYPYGDRRVKKCWRSSRGCNSAITRHIERIGPGIKRTDEARDGSLSCY